MTMPERMQRWWKWHEGWVAAGVLTALAFCFGWTASTIHDQARGQAAFAQQTLAHARDMQSLTDAYREALAAKDKLIATMANSSADAASSAAQAADAAAQAADKSRTDTATLRKLK